jgi:hypothetical protein
LLTFIPENIMIEKKKGSGSDYFVNTSHQKSSLTPFIPLGGYCIEE